MIKITQKTWVDRTKVSAVRDGIEGIRTIGLLVDGTWIQWGGEVYDEAKKNINAWFVVTDEELG